MNDEKLYLQIINNLTDGIYFVDQKRRITFWNKGAERISGYKAEEILGRYCQDNTLNHIDKNGKSLCTMHCPLFTTMADGKERSHNVFLRHKEGYRVPVSVNVFPIIEDGIIIGAVEIFQTNSKEVFSDDFIENLSNLATCDPLTGLPNRRKMESFLEFKLTEMKRFGTLFCVVFLDIDDFRTFNNEFGHDTGDEVLKVVSCSITSTTRKNDLFGRWGGEEFIGVFMINNPEDAKIIAEKVRTLILRSEINCREKCLSVTASLGVVVAREDDTLDSIVKRADELMYASKQSGKNRVTSDLK